MNRDDGHALLFTILNLELPIKSLSSLHCYLFTQNTSTIIFMIYQVTVADFFVVIAIYIDIFKQFLD